MDSWLHFSYWCNTVSFMLAIVSFPYYSVLLTKSGQEIKCGFMGSVPLGQSIPCHPCSESPFVSGQNYRYLKLRPQDTGHDLLARIQKMQQADKSGHVVGFIIGSTLTSCAKLPANFSKELGQLDQVERKLPPLIVLKVEAYDQFWAYAKSHSFSVKEIQCLSDIGSKFMIVSSEVLITFA